MKPSKTAVKATIAAGIAAAMGGGAGTAVAEDHHLRVIVGLATIDARAEWWTQAELQPYACNTPTYGDWWHCDDGPGRPALDLLKGDGTVTDLTVVGPCPTDQSVWSVCGAPVYFQAHNMAPSAWLVAQTFAHPSTSGCSGVSVRIFRPEDQVNDIARFEFVHIDERQVNQRFLIGDNYTVFYLGRVRHPDCPVSTGPHLHQSGGPVGPVVSKNNLLTIPCESGTPCRISPTGDYTNKWMHDVFWQTFPTPTPSPTAVPTATNTPIPPPPPPPGGK
ncbi:MAG: hypothetical protein ACYC9X_11025 [Dehalococcoidia bacterium]